MARVTPFGPPRSGARTLLVVLLAAVAALALAACGGNDDEPADVGVGDDYATALEFAPIHELEMRVAESFPPQYFLGVVSGLPSGCARLAGSDVANDGTTIRVTVSNRVPAPGVLVACTAIYGYAESTVALGTGADFTSGVTYTVLVNGERTSFVAQ
ncbi:MAG: hypothetical protein O3C25_04495 [Chloroflexi bacterium]|nr:hypothetical protein [Chloroflexota bacterium]